jgi:hypothetical protein
LIVRAWPKKDYFTRSWGPTIVASSFLLTSSLSLSNAQNRLPGPVVAQGSAQGSHSREGSISGRVVDEAGQPFPRIAVEIRPVNGAYEEKRETVTDDEGGFKVDGLSAKAYTVECQVSGYVEDDGDRSNHYYLIGDSVTLKFSKGGVITGKATDELREPLVKAKIGMQRVRDGEGRLLRVAQSWGDVKTDDRGIYRAYGLEEGSYILMVGQVGEYEDDELRNQSTPTYFPSSTADDAGEVVVRRGAEVSGIDIIRREIRGHAVSGKCSGVTHKRSEDETYVKLVRARNGVIQAGGWQGHEQNRAFSFYGVPDGDYYLIAQDDYDEPGAASTPLRIKIAGNDVTGLELKLIPFGSIAGRVLMESAPTSAGTPVCKPKRQPAVQEIIARVLRDSDDTRNDLTADLFGSERSSLPDENGNFVLDHLAPGRYRVRMNLVSEDLYVRSITMVGRLPEQRIPAGPLTIKSADNIKGVVVSVSAGAASVGGRTVTADQTSKLPAGVRVHLVPAEPEEAADALRFLQTDAQVNGEFVFTNVAPGRYWLLARPGNARSQPGPTEPSDAIRHAGLRREAAVVNNSIQLQPCQRTTNYILRYVPTSPEPSRKVARPPNPLVSTGRKLLTAS